MRRQLATFVPGLDGQFVRGVACMYTNTTDYYFVIATHPQYAQVTVAAGFSGHGFKFVPVGEIIADLVTTGHTAHPIGMFDPQRFTGGVLPVPRPRAARPTSPLPIPKVRP